MKNSIFTIALMLLTTGAFAQVGIGTQNPQQFFHIDGAVNNPASGAPSASDAADDFVVTNAGRVGIGTVNPVTNLHIAGNTSGITAPFTNAALTLTGNTLPRIYWEQPNHTSGSRVISATYNGGKFIFAGLSDNASAVGTFNSLLVLNNNDGKVGIGTDIPSSKLSVRGNEGDFASISIEGNSTDNGAYVLFNNTNHASGRHWAVGSTGTLNGPGTAGVGSFEISDVTGTPTTRFVINPAGNVGIGPLAPNARLDIRTDPTSTSDPGAGMFGIGTTAVTAATAGAGAMRYSTASGGQLQYSNGVAWNTLTSTVTRATVVAKKTTSQSFNNTPANAEAVTDWVEITDLTSNFNPSTGVFTAPRTGNYSIGFSYNFTFGSINAGSQSESILESSGGTLLKSVVAYPAAGSAQAGSAISFVVSLTAGETIRPFIWHSLGVTRHLRIGTGDDDGFVNFSVAEL